MSGFRYYMLNKPQGLLSACADRTRPTVMECFPPELREGLHPVGRLDKDTEGFLILTDDGMLDQRLLRPERHVRKEYEFYAFGRLGEAEFARLSAGVALEGSGYRTRPCETILLPPQTIGSCEAFLPQFRKSRFLKNPYRPVTHGILYLTEGRKHQVKLMVKAMGGHVFWLRRHAIGPVRLDPALQPGQYRALFPLELEALLQTEEKS